MISPVLRTILQLTCICKSKMLPALRMGGPMHKRGLKRRRACLRQLTLSLGLLCLMSYASSTMHLLLVEHVHCAEHGKLAHADEDHGHDHSIVTTSVSKAEDRIRASNPTAKHGHGHDHDRVQNLGSFSLRFVSLRVARFCLLRVVWIRLM